MKMTSALGILISFTALTSCAPVASSSPKLGQQHRGEALIDSGKDKSGKDKNLFDLSVVPRAKIVSSEKEYDAYIKHIKTLGDFTLEEFKGNDAEILELLETDGIQRIKFLEKLGRMELIAVFLVDASNSFVAAEDGELKMKAERLKDEKDLFSLSIDPERTAEGAWAFIKKNLNRVAFAHRVVKAEIKN